jgi:Protein of unknown function (DUF3040)
VPLSENEQRVLRQIERQFQHEHWLARSLRVPEDARHAARNARRASLGFVLGLVALLLSFASSWVVGLIGFVIMLAAGVTLVQSVRRLVEDRWGPAASPSSPGEGADAVGGRPGRGVGGQGGRWWAAGGGRGPRGGDDDGRDRE